MAFGKKLGLVVAITSLILLSSLSHSVVVRKIDAESVVADEDIPILLDVQVNEETYYAIDEQYPSGFTVSDAGTGNVEEEGHIKWLVLENAVDIILSYTLSVPSLAGTYSFLGTYMFEGMPKEAGIEGDNQLQVVNQDKIVDKNKIFDKNYYYREGEGIYIDSIDRNTIKVDGQDIKIKWGYDKEIIYSGKIATKDRPYNLLFPTTVEHQLPQAIDACKGELVFITTYPMETEIWWDYNVPIPTYGYDVNTAECLEQVDKDHCAVTLQGLDVPRHCDINIKDGNCFWNQRYINGYNQKTETMWFDVTELKSCPLEANKTYNLRHKASVPAGTHIVFDVNMVVTPKEMEKFVLIIEIPEWISTAAEDYNVGVGIDFNWTKVTQDANVMPTGSDKVYVEQDQTFYDNDLVAYWRFDDKNATHIFDDTNNDNNGSFENDADINAWGMWDTNAGFFDAIDNHIETPFIPDSSTLSMSMWVKFNKINKRMIFAGVHDESDHRFYIGIGFADGSRYFSAIGNSYKGYDPGGLGGTAHNFSTGVWYHVALTGDGSTARYYVDGTQVDSFSYTYVGGAQTDWFPIGGLRNNGSMPAAYFFDGSIDKVKVYSKTLTAEEIQQDYNSWMTDATYTSPVKDAGAAANWDTIRWLEDSDVNNSLTVDYRGCSTSDCSTAGDWQIGLSGGNTEHSDIYADNNQYFQYRVNFDTNAASWNPVRSDDADKGSFGRFYDMNVTYTLVTPNVAPDANVLQVEGNDFNAPLPSFDYDTDGNLPITFSATDSDQDDLDFSMWYDTSSGGKTNLIIDDINLSTDPSRGNCDTNNKTAMFCTWDFNISGLADANYWITIEITDGTDTNTATSERSFRVNPSVVTTCNCPSSGHWEIDDGSSCTLATECNLSSGGLHIVSGSLDIVSGGTLNIPAGQKATMEKSADVNLVIHTGGKLVIHE